MSADGWMCALTLQEGAEVDVRQFHRTQSPWRASEKGLLPLKLEEYLAVLDWTGRQPREGKAGAIPSDLTLILKRLGINDTVDRLDEPLQ